MTFFDSVIVNLKGVIGSRKDGVYLNNLNTEYSTMAGEDVPVRQLGYNSIQHFLNSHKDLFQIQGEGRFSRVFNVMGQSENDTTVELLNLIQNTHIKKKKKGGIGRSINSYQCLPYKPSYQKNYHTGYNHNQIGFHQNMKPLQDYKVPAFGFMNAPHFSVTIPNNLKETLRQASNDSRATMGFRRPPYIPPVFSNGNKEIKDTNYLVPAKCFKSAQNSNVVVISDDDDTDIVYFLNVATQTSNELFKGRRRLFGSLSSVQLVNMIIDVFVQFKVLKNNEVLKIRIEGDLHSLFCLLTGYNVDPILFYDYTLQAMDSPTIQHLYKSLIYLDPAKKDCLFNLKSIFSTKMSLPDYDLNFRGEYIVEIIKIFHDNLVGYKILNKFHPSLNWEKNTLPDKSKEIIESQPFWSWIPGTLCLVQLPFVTVKKYDISPVERAIIMGSEMATLSDESIQESQLYLIHNTSFYLIDHDLEIANVFSCSSSYQEVKKNAKGNNNCSIAFVCNMSICARNTPSKIQFAKLENYKDVSSNFLDENQQIKSGAALVLKNIKKMTVVFHFQLLYSCIGSIYKPVESSRTLKDYNDVSKYQSDEKYNTVEVSRTVRDYNDVPKFRNEHKESEKRMPTKDVIVISDSDDDLPVKITPTISKGPILYKTPVSSYSEKLPTTNISTSHIRTQKIDLYKCPYFDEPSPVICSPSIISKYNSVVSEPLETPKYSYKTADMNHISEKVEYETCSEKIKIEEMTTCANNIEPITIVNTTCTANNNIIEKVSIVSYSESDDENDSLDDLNNGTIVTSYSMNNGDVSLSNSVISYLENNSNHTVKCLRPLTTDMINIFAGRVVKILHIQSGSAALILFDSFKLMKRDIKLMSLNKEALRKAENVLVGDLFIWCQQTEHSDKIDYSLVEVVQVVSKTSVLTNNVHQGLLVVVNVSQLYCLPNERKSDMQTLLGPQIGAFDLHMIPDWFTPDDLFDVSNELFTAYFAENGKLILEYFEQPCKFLNIEMIDSIEKSLSTNHCNVKSVQFIEMLSKSLLQCRLYVGNILEMIEYSGENFDQLLISKVLCKVSSANTGEVCFASVLIRSESDPGCYEKVSPHSYLDDLFCIDRVTFDSRRNSFRLMEYQNVYVDAPYDFDGVYRFDRREIRGYLTSNEEFHMRYMFAGATDIPDLKVLQNKLIFNIHGL